MELKSRDISPVIRIWSPLDVSESAGTVCKQDCEDVHWYILMVYISFLQSYTEFKQSLLELVKESIEKD